MISRSSFLMRESTSAFGGEWVLPNATRGLSLFSVNLATKGLVHLHYRFLKGGTETLIASLRHTPTTELGAPKTPQYVTMTKTILVSRHKLLGFPKKHKEQRDLKWMRGKWRSGRWRCRSASSPSIPQRSRTLGGWGRRSWAFWWLDNGVFFYSGRASLSGGEYLPFIGLPISDRLSRFLR